MSETLAKMNKLVLKQRRVRADAENTLYKIQNSKNIRIMKCPVCGGQAKSNDPEKPFVCKCGWRSDKMNGGTQ